MIDILMDYIKKIEGLHSDIGDVLLNLPQDALDWSPHSDVPTIGVFVTHIAGADKYWMADVVLNEPSDRDRDAEFETRGKSAGELLELLAANRDYFQEKISKFTESDLSKICISPRNGAEITAGWALLHILEHTALHLGHIQIVRQLWEKHQG